MNSTHSSQVSGGVVTVAGGGSKKQFISARRSGSDELSILDACRPVAGAVAAQIVFGGCDFEALAEGADWPRLWVQGDVCPGTHLAGAQAFVLDGRPVGRVVLGGRVVGSTWSDDDADYCLLAGILPADLNAGCSVQTRSSFDQMEAALREAGMDFSHVVRTWFYLDELLAWYDAFNAERTAFFEARGVFDRLIPASTGIGAGNPAGAALASGALAIRPRHAGVRIREVGSPLQNPATDYRSSFSRAVEVGFPGRRLLTISGTASIAPDGRSLHAGDVSRQIHLTLDVVQGILRSRGMDWSDTVRAIGYFHDIRELATFDAICRERGLPALPLAPAHATVCRADLLFEMELDAMSFTPAPDGL